MSEKRDIRGCCPRCGSSNLENAGWLMIEAMAKTEIWLIDNVITYKFSEVDVGGYTTLKEKEYSEFYKTELFKMEECGFQCRDCYHGFRGSEAKAAIKGPPLEKLVQGVLE